MRIKFFIAAVLLICSTASAESPLLINISNAGVEINGITYKTRPALVEALRKLKPSVVRLVSAKDATYQAVRDTFEALQESGIQAQTGFVGAEQPGK